MSFSSAETEQIVNFLSILDSVIKQNLPNQNDKLKLLFKRNEKKKTQCIILLNDTVNKTKLDKINQVINYYSNLMNENTKEKQWNGFTFKIEENKGETQSELYQDLIDLDGNSTSFEFSNTKTDMIITFDDFLDKEISDKFISIFQSIENQSDLIKKLMMIKLIINCGPSEIITRNNQVNQIRKLLEDKAVKPFKDIITVYLKEMLPKYDNLLGILINRKEVEVSLVNKNENYKETFTYSLCFPTKIAEFIRKRNNNAQKLMKNLRKVCSNLRKFQYSHLLTFDISFIADYIMKEQKICINSIRDISLKGEIRTREYAFLKEIKESFPESCSEIKEIRTFGFIPTNTCVECSKMINVDDYQYFCYWCKIAFCLECVETTIENNNGRNCYIHKQHNLMYFKTKNKEDLEDLDEYKLGRNLFASASEISARRHSAICNGCHNQFYDKKNNQRYLCISCYPGIKRSGGFNDYCYKCILNMRNKTGNYQSHVSSDENHVDEKHVQLMLIYQTVSYSDY